MESMPSDDVVRVRVVASDGSALLCRALDGGDVRVSYATGTSASPYDSTYLRGLVHSGSRLNIVGSWRDDDGLLHARFLVAEPDYLVNVTSVAGCMADYGDSPYVGLMRRLAPAPNSEALQMGNFAGRLLDEALHGDSRTKPYADSVRDFFRTAATGIMALGAGFDSCRFHSEAMRQQANIRVAVEQALPQRVPGFDPAAAVVEPSFFCEALGLQGRMDCLTLDGTVVVEQKSGKGAFGSHGHEIPEMRREHFAQLLLYRVALRYGYPGTDATALLLYSKYSRGLIDATNSEPLLQQAMELRNRLAAAEIACASDGFGALARLTPDSFNRRGVSGTLWTRYQRPQLAAILAPLAAADDVERAYYMRMMRFVAMEHMLSKLGNGDGSGFASAWLCTPDEKRAAGNMLDGLRLVSPADGHAGKVESISLEYPDDGSGDMANFRSADIVLLYSYDRDSVPDIRQALPLRCTVNSIGAGMLHLQLRTPQSDARVFSHDASRLWAVEHDFIESASDAQFRALHSLLAAPRERRDLLLGRRRPRVDASVAVAGDYGDFSEMVGRAVQARDLFLLVGPPGTGKTSHGLVDILKEELVHDGAYVLLMAYTNRAVDEICSKLGMCGIDYVRLGPASACAPFCRSHTVDAVVGAARRLADVERRLRSSRVFVATTAALNSRIELLGMHSFSLAIIDEASQILEPQLAGVFGAMCGGRPSVERFVMIGDHRQLPAVVRQSADESRVDEPSLRELGLENCRMSLFERMLRRYGDDASLSYMLTRQGRMHPDIADFPSRTFYGGRLRAVPLPHQLAPSPGARVRFIPVAPDAGDVSEKVNGAEAAVIAGIVAAVREREGAAFDPADSVGVIVPYRNQIAAVRGALLARGIAEAADISVDTVERFQGSQRRHIVFGFTVRNVAQLEFLTDSTIRDIDGTLVDRRLNVALTRAREYLTIVGNPGVLLHNPIYAALISCCHSYSIRNA